MLLNVDRGVAVQNKNRHYMKIRKLFIMLLLAAFTLSVGLPLSEAAPAKGKHAQVAKGKGSKKGKAQKKKQKKQNKRQKRHQEPKQQKKNSRKQH